MRIHFLAVALAALLAAPTTSLAHGTERHYGNPFGKTTTKAAPPSPAFSMLLVDMSLKAIGRTLRGEAEESVEERLEQIGRSTAALLSTTGSDGEFSSFATTFKTQSPLLLEALRSSSAEEALATVDALRNSFGACKRLYAAQHPES